MPDSAEEEKSEAMREEGEADTPKTPKRLRPRWQRWLLWSSVRLFLLLGVGAGVGTVQWRSRPPDLMAHAKRIASIAGAGGYYWTPRGELRLYRNQRNGTASLKWDQATQSATFVEMLKPPKGQFFADPNRTKGPFATSSRRQDQQSQVLIVEAYKKDQPYTRDKPMPNADYTWKIRAMPGLQADFYDTALSPDGKRIAYKSLIPNVDWRDEIMRRVRRGYQPPYRGQGAVILISSVDGSRTEMLGKVKEDMPATRSGTTYSLQCFYWRPDGKHLTFAYGDGVYEVPVK